MILSSIKSKLRSYLLKTPLFIAIPFGFVHCSGEQMPKNTLAEVCSAWEDWHPSRTDKESTIRQARDNNKVRRKVCVS